VKPAMTVADYCDFKTETVFVTGREPRNSRLYIRVEGKALQRASRSWRNVKARAGSRAERSIMTRRNPCSTRVSALISSRGRGMVMSLFGLHMICVDKIADYEHRTSC